jgi:hypothetical protein
MIAGRMIEDGFNTDGLHGAEDRGRRDRRPNV